MTKEGFQQYVFDRDGNNLDLDKFSWHKYKRVFTTEESGLTIKAPNLHNCTFKTGCDCEFYIGDNCTFETGDNCTFYKGDDYLW